jgi:hypothetical protein
VEYNQLDPLLRSQGDGKGDVADPATGYSPYPGNVNNIVIELGAYAKTLRGEDQGVVLEFVNPKYKDGSRTEFKKPTRLECMMQDIPKLFQKEMGSDVNIGFTTFDRWFTFSPAKVRTDIKFVSYVAAIEMALTSHLFSFLFRTLLNLVLKLSKKEATLLAPCHPQNLTSTFRIRKS